MTRADLTTAALPGAERIWRRATTVIDPADHHDVLSIVLELLRAAHHDVDTVSSALALGRIRSQAEPDDVAVERGVRCLEQALTFMGVELPVAPASWTETTRARKGGT